MLFATSGYEQFAFNRLANHLVRNNDPLQHWRGTVLTDERAIRDSLRLILSTWGGDLSPNDIAEKVKAVKELTSVRLAGVAHLVRPFNVMCHMAVVRSWLRIDPERRPPERS